MRKYTVDDLGKILGLENSLISNFDSLDEDKKYQTLEVLWDSLYELHDKLTTIKYKKFLQEAEDGKRKLTSNLMGEAKSAVWKDFDEILAGKPQEVNEIEEIRNKLKFLIK